MTRRLRSRLAPLLFPLAGWVGLPSHCSEVADAVREPISATDALRAELVELARLVAMEKWNEAARRLEPLRQAHPDQPELLLFNAAAKKGAGDHAEGRRLARAFLDRFPDSINRDQALYLLGSSLLESGSRTEAARVLREASAASSDASFRARITAMLQDSRPNLRVGIRLGGKPPRGAIEVEREKRAARRILERAMRDYREVHGKNLERIEDLLSGDPPILRALPEDPEHPGRLLEPGFP